MTQKLTAEKARELRDAITKNAAVIEPTIRDLYIVQAIDRMLEAEARVVKLEQYIESIELQMCADAAADDYHRSESDGH